MNIGYFLRTFPQLSETFVFNEIEVIRKNGHEVSLVALYRPRGISPPFLTRLSQKTLYFSDIDKSDLPTILLAHLRFFLSKPSTYVKALKRWIPDLGFAWTIKMVLIADYFANRKICHLHTHFAWEQVDALRFIHDLTKIPFSLTVHAADIYSEPYKLKEAINEADFVVTISQFNREHLVKTYNLSHLKCHVIHCGVNINNFTEANQPFLEDKLRILSVGRLVEKKGFDILLRAIAEVIKTNDKLEVNIIGDGPLLNNLLKLSSELSLNKYVNFLGALPHDEVIENIKKCDIVTLACRIATNGDMDGIPVVLMEAMAAKRLVISTKINGIHELIKDDSGLIVDPESTTDLSNAILYTLSNRDKLITICNNGFHTVKSDFSLEKQGEKLCKLISQSKVNTKF